MKLLVAALLTLTGLVSVPEAQAKDVPLIRLTCESSKIEIPMGLIVADQNPKQILGFYYVDEAGSRKPFKMSDLEELTPVYTDDGTDAAYAAMTANTAAGTAELTIKYLKNGIWKSYRSVTFDVRYNASMTQYEVINPSTKRPITAAYIIPNRLGKKIIGITRIEMR